MRLPLRGGGEVGRCRVKQRPAGSRQRAFSFCRGEDGGGLVDPLCSQNVKSGRSPVLVLCSRSAHDRNVLARRPQLDQHGRPSKEYLEKKANRCAQFEDQPGHPLKEQVRKKLPPSRPENVWKGCSAMSRP